MTWVRLEDVQAALSRVTAMSDHVFLGRADLKPQASFVAVLNPTTLSIDFTDTSVDPTGSTIATWSWRFGDGTTSTSQNPSHTYAAAGNYLVSLTITNSSGFTGVSQAFQEFVEQPDPLPVELVGPTAAFSSNVVVRTATFTDASTDPDGTITTWEWDFGDGPVANFTSVATGLGVAFTDTSTDPDGSIASRSWSFGDGSTSTATNPSHTYASAGTYDVTLTVTDNGSNSDQISKLVTVTTSTTLGTPFCCFEGLNNNTSLKANLTAFNGSVDQPSAANLVIRLNAARDNGFRLFPAMTGGAHTNYTTNGVFVLQKWKDKMDTFNTPAIRTAVADGVAGGWLVGNSVMDEPQHSSWGGVMTKPLLDQMYDYVRAIFPTLPCGVVMGGRPDWRANETWQRVDFVVYQYSWIEPQHDEGNVTQFRDTCLAQAARDGTKVIFSLNIMNGGFRSPQDPTAAGCPTPYTGGPGTYSTNCRMTSSQLSTYGTTLAAAGLGMTIWRYDSTFMGIAANKTAFNAIRDVCAARPLISWRRGV